MGRGFSLSGITFVLAGNPNGKGRSAPPGFIRLNTTRGCSAWEIRILLSVDFRGVPMPNHYLKTELYSRLRENPQIFDFIQEAALDGLWLWDLENPEHEWMSPGFWRLFGYEPEEKQHLASEWQDMIFDEDREKALANFKAHLADPDHPYDQIVRYRHKKGHTVWVRCRGLALRDESGAATRLLGAHVDISEVVALRQGELEDTTSLLTQVLNTASSGIIGLNEKGMILSINPAARHMLGAINEPPPFAWPSSIQFLDNEDLHPQTDADSPLVRALQGKQVKQEIHLITRAKSVTNRYVRISSSPIESETSPVRFVMLMDDVSEQEMNRQQVERKSRLDALGQLTGGIAHDFNNLLAGILGNAGRVLDTRRGAPPPAFLADGACDIGTIRLQHSLFLSPNPFRRGQRLATY